MHIGNVDFGEKYVFAGSGFRNLDGQGWSHHKLMRLVAPGFQPKATIPVTKTVTVDPREGNMPLKSGTFMPKERRPKCVAIDWIRGEVVNSVGLTNPGLAFMLRSGAWKHFTEPWIMSIMFLGSEEEQLYQVELFTKILAPYLRFGDLGFLAAIEVNVSCPNTGENTDVSNAVSLLHSIFDHMDVLGFPLLVKFNLETNPETAFKIASHPAVNGVTIPNTTPWGSKSVHIDWKEVFPRVHHHGKDTVNGVLKSPLADVRINGHDIGNGGLSSWRVFPAVCSWIKKLRRLGYSGIIIGGAIYHPGEVRFAFASGANAIFIGASGIVRFWRVGDIINEANRVGRLYETERAENIDEPAVPRTHA